MKKLLITLLLTTTAFASGVEFEYGSEVYTQAPHIKGLKIIYIILNLIQEKLDLAMN